MAGPARLALAIPLIAVLLALGLWAAKLGRAETAADEVTQQINSWRSRQFSPPLETWQQARRDLDEARRLAPGSGAVEEVVGLLLLGRRQNSDFPEVSLEHFARALVLRPSFPYTWANIAVARYRLGKTTGDFEQILVTAAALGPNEPFVQGVVVDLGLALWDEIGAETRASVLLTLESGFRRNPMEMLQISDRRGRLDLACPRIPENARFPDPRWAKLCEKTT